MTDGSGDSASGSTSTADSDHAPDPDSAPNSDSALDSDSAARTFEVSIDAVQPGQLYLNGRKLALVTQWFDFAEPNYDPLPVRSLGSENDGEPRWMLTDGHTRAFVAHLAGADDLRVVRNTDDLPMDVYRQCVEWCEEEGVTDVADLAGRVLNADDFEEQWVARCRAAADGTE